MRITLTQIAQATGGELQRGLGEQTIHGVCTDSRRIERDDLFVALSGDQFDGHNFLVKASAAGAAAALVSRIPDEVPESWPLIVVEDTLTAYGKLAGWYRRQSDVTVIAVTGSVGKTTTKNMIGSILARHGPTLVSPRSENNEVGLPRTLLSLEGEHSYCVVEAAMRGPGQIAYLADIAAPDVGIITNVGETHLGLLGSRDAIAQAKAELLHGLPTEGTAVLNADDFYYDLFVEMTPYHVVSFGRSPQADVRIGQVTLQGLSGSEFSVSIGQRSVDVELALPGMYNVINAAGAAAAAWAVTDSVQHIATGLAACPTEEMRSEVHSTPEGATIINDAYNAAPTSVAAALELLEGLPTYGRKVFVFGDMLELGKASADEHEAIGRLCGEKDIDWLISLGRWAPLAAEQAASAGLRTTVVADADEAVNLLRAELNPPDIVLVKASRAMALERVVQGLVGDNSGV